MKYIERDISLMVNEDEANVIDFLHVNRNQGNKEFNNFLIQNFDWQQGDGINSVDVLTKAIELLPTKHLWILIYHGLHIIFDTIKENDIKEE